MIILSKHRLILSLILAAALLSGLFIPAALAEVYTAEFGAQFNPDVNADVGEWPDLSAYAISFVAGEEAVILIEFDAPVAFGGNYAAINTNFAADGAGKMISFKLDGNDVAMGDVYLNNEGIDGGLRLTICNKWNSNITEQPVDVETLGEFTTLEIVFCVTDTVPGAEDTNDIQVYTAEFGAQFNPEVNADMGEWPDLSAYAISFAAGEEAVILIEFDAPVAFGGNYAAINTNFAADGAGEIISFKLDGNDVAMGDVYLNNEGIDGGLRLTICNKWNGNITEQPVDVETLGEFTVMEIVFTVSEPVQQVFEARFEAQFNPEVNADVGEWPDSGAWTTAFAAGDEAVLTVSFDAPVAFGGNYAAVNTNFPANGIGEIISLKLDDVIIPMGAVYLNAEAPGGLLRMTICNKWNSDIVEQPLDVETLEAFTTLQIVFTVVPGAPVEEDVYVSSAPPFEPEGVYHAYLGVQSASYTFRNAWADGSYGAEGGEWEKQPIGNNFYGLTGWDGDAVVRGGVFADCEIKGNGDYTVTLNGFDFGEDESFNILFVSTDIPLAGHPVAFTDIIVRMDGSTKYIFDSGYIPGISSHETKDYYEVHCINIWSGDLGGNDGLFGYSMPANSIELAFTVSGFDYDKN